jgi:hypothetical protein
MSGIVSDDDESDVRPQARGICALVTAWASTKPGFSTVDPRLLSGV